MKFDVVIIGGGVVGVAIAAELSCTNLSIALLEKEAKFGTGISSRNSEVVHAGIYYDKNTLKAKFCVSGRKTLYNICAANRIPYSKCGKLIVATSESQIPVLHSLLQKGTENGVSGLRILDSREVQVLEPHVFALAALYSPESGIIDTHSLISYYKRVAEKADAVLVSNCEVTDLSNNQGEWGVFFSDSQGFDSVNTTVVVNCAGLNAQNVMRMAGLSPEDLNLKLHMCKGEYFSVSAANARLLSHLIYPVPEKRLKSLGIHTVLNLAGDSKLGPSADFVSNEDYAVDESNAVKFWDSASAYLPFLKSEKLTPDMAGIRPKLSGDGEPPRDFYIAHELHNGARGFINLVGIDSPGLTASPAIATYVKDMIIDLL